MEGFIGEIRLWAPSFEPETWAFCDGRLLQIAQYSALFSVIGNTYGGDGMSTFALPDLRGAAALGVGNRNGVSTALGELGTLDRSAAGTIETMGMNYIICLEGIYPTRA